MSQLPADNLNSNRIRRLLASAGAESDQDAKQNVEAFEYDWRQPRYFGRSQLIELKHFAEDIAATASAEFSRLFQTDFSVTTDSTSQHFAGEFTQSDQEDGGPEYYLAFGPAASQNTPENQPWGLIGIPRQTALNWATQSLGDTGAEQDADRDLSQLERSLLVDAASVLVQAVSKSYPGQALGAVGEIVLGRFPLNIENTTELCKITFDAKKADSDEATKAFVLMLCDKLEPLTTTVVQTQAPVSAEDSSAAVADNLRRMNVSVTARLGSAIITFAQLMDLADDDILILETKTNEPIDVTVEELRLLRGRPAKSAGHYAVAITEIAFGTTN